MDSDAPQRIVDADERQRMIAEAMPIVHSIARRYAINAKRALGIELADLVQEGAIAAIRAVNRFDPSQGAQWKTYVAPSVRGAILDFVRDSNLAPRTLQYRANRVQEIRNRYNLEYERLPTEAEYAAELGCTIVQYRRLRFDLAALMPAIGTETAMVSSKTGEDLTTTVAETLLLEPTLTDETFWNQEIAAEVRAAIAELPATLRFVIRAKFFDGYSFTAIADRLGASVPYVVRQYRDGLELVKRRLTRFLANSA